MLLVDYQSCHWRVSICLLSELNRRLLSLNHLLTEHKRATENGDVNNYVAKHYIYRRNIKSIDWDCATRVLRILQTTTNDLLYTAGSVHVT